MKKKYILITAIVVFSLMCSCAYVEELTSWTCSSCGTLNSGNFCTNCGARRNESDSWVCKNCNTVNKGNFCSNCGSSKETANTATQQDNRMASSSGRHADKDKLNDSMIATIDGTEYEFILTKVKLERNRIVAYYETYNPRGEVLYDIYIALDKSISPGEYKSDSSDAFSVHYKLLKAQGKGPYSKMEALKPIGSFTLELLYRSEDWMTYSGKFTAHLVKEASAFGKKETMDISNAEFSFTIPDSSRR